MNNDNPKDKAVNNQANGKPVSGASAFKPTTTQELEEIRQRKARNDDARRQIAEEQQQQHIRKKLLAECQPVLNVNYEWLDLDDYPDNRTVARAKRNRDYWLVICTLEFVVFSMGIIEWVPAWIGGTAFGLLFITLCFSLKGFRRFFIQGETLSELLQVRKKLEFRALNHIKLLEGQEGFDWKCRKLAKYNRNLDRRLFQGVMNMSAQKRLFGVIKEKKHIRLYLQLMLEAEKAYKRLQADYLKHHFDNLEKGVDDTVSEGNLVVTSPDNNEVSVIAPDSMQGDNKVGE